MFENYKKKESNEEARKVFRLGVIPSGAENKKIGGIRTHLMNYAFAKSEKEKWGNTTIIYRVDDTGVIKKMRNLEKTKSDFDFFSEMLGFDFDITPYNSQELIGQSVFQSERKGIYMSSVEELFDNNIAFIDNNSGLTLFDIEKFIQKFSNIIEYEDLKNGKVKFDIENNLRQGTKYFPLFRSDGSVLYHLATVVDDAAFGVTHLVRGEDKIPIIQYQEMVRIALDLQPKKYLHTPMLRSVTPEEKQKLRFFEFIKNGILPQALISYMISSCYGDTNKIYPSIEEFVHEFEYTKMRNASGYFDIQKLENINKQVIKITTKEVFIGSIFLYLKNNQENDLIELIANDVYLLEFLNRTRRDPVESTNMIKSINFPIYEPLVDESKQTIEYILSNFNDSDDLFLLNDDLDKKLYYNALRWILLGKYNFPEIKYIYEYLKSKNEIYRRIEVAKAAYAQQVDIKSL